MIYGIGTDVVDIKRIEKLLTKFNERLINKILSSNEQQQITNYPHHNFISFVAKRFVAKEAFAKACGTGLITPITFKNITITNDHLGKPIFVFAPAVNNWLQMRNIRSWHISICDTKYLANACVVLEC
jgi:holo-[acyl-carrier protein] synthase